MLSLAVTQISKKTILIFFFLLALPSFIFSQEKSLDVASNTVKSKELTPLREQAIIYRNQGLKLQELGDLEGAMNLYQKAIVLDPAYAAVYNDLGIVYEAYGFIDRAKESYLKCIKIDPRYLGAYSNLALFYENKRDLKKALFYWEKRVDLGSPSDPWTEKARKRLEDTRSVLSNKPLEEMREQEVFSLMKEVTKEKVALQQDEKLLSQRHFEKAKKRFADQDLAAAIKEALDAQQLDPANQEIEKFIEKVQTRALSR